MTPKPIIRVDDDERFLIAMGHFFGAWALVELLTDYAIHKFLKVTPLQAHLITAGMMFGRKARLLADLIGRSDHERKSEILGAFNKLRWMSKRDIFAHSYVKADENIVTFIERNAGGEAKAIAHTFTLLEFATYVHDFCVAAQKFEHSLEADDLELTAFGDAALSLNRSDSKLSASPSESAE